MITLVAIRVMPMVKGHQQMVKTAEDVAVEEEEAVEAVEAVEDVEDVVEEARTTKMIRMLTMKLALTFLSEPLDVNQGQTYSK